MFSLSRLAFLVLAILAIFFVQCGDGAGGEGNGSCEGDFPDDRFVYPDEVAAGGDPPDVIASDEAALRVWDKRCEAKPLEGAADLVTPADGATVARDALELIWEQTLARAPAPAKPRMAAQAIAAPRVWLGVQEASAHLPPVTGWVYLVELQPPSGPSLWVFTSQKRWQPDPVLRAAMEPGTWTVRITSAWLERNVVTEGPWLGAAHTFELVEE